MTAYDQECRNCRGIFHRNWRCVTCGGSGRLAGNGSASSGGMPKSTKIPGGRKSVQEDEEAT